MPAPSSCSTAAIASTLYRFLLRQLGNVESAEELFQDLWMRVVNSRGRYQARAKFTSWVYAIAHNRLMDFLPRERPGPRS